MLYEKWSIFVRKNIQINLKPTLYVRLLSTIRVEEERYKKYGNFKCPTLDEGAFISHSFALVWSQLEWKWRWVMLWLMIERTIPSADSSQWHLALVTLSNQMVVMIFWLLLFENLNPPKCECKTVVRLTGIYSNCAI